MPYTKPIDVDTSEYDPKLLDIATQLMAGKLPMLQEMSTKQMHQTSRISIMAASILMKEWQRYCNLRGCFRDELDPAELGTFDRRGWRP